MHTVEIVFTAQEILVGRADYPTPEIGETSRQFRQLGLGYANLGALLMALGHPYDSADGRAWAAALTSLMTGHAYATSARTASRMGPFAGYADNEEHMLRVLRMHRDAAYQLDASRCRSGRTARGEPGGMGRGCPRWRGVRRPQQPGQRPRADRHHRVDDGLRHDGHRARSRPRQDEEARRWRHDVDRQPHRAAGARPARLSAGRRSTTSSPTSTSTSRSSVRPTCRPNTSLCSPARWATTRSTTRATCG